MSRQFGQQALLIAIGLAVWSAVGEPSLLALLLAYLGVWLSCQWRPLRRVLSALRGRQLGVLVVLIAVPALAWAYRARAKISEREHWTGLSANVFDRFRLEVPPAIAPGLVSGDRPQTFYVRAPGARSMRVRFGSKARERSADQLGSELFRVEYDPRRDGPLQPADGELGVRIATDAGQVERRLRSVTPLVHPRWFCESPQGTRAATPSEETDELIVSDGAGRVSRIAVGDGPSDCVFADETSVIVSHRFESRLAVYDVASGRLQRTLDVPGRHGRMALDPQASRLVVASVASEPDAATLLIVKWPEFALLERVQLPAAADWLAFGRDAGTLIVSTRADATLRLFAPQPDHYAQRVARRLGRPAATLGRARDGSRVWIATTDYRPDATPQLGNHFVQDQLLTFATSGLELSERRMTARRSERQSKPGDLDMGVSPMGIRELRDGTLAISFAGTDELWRFRPGAVGPDVLDLSETAVHAPHGIAELADGTLLVSSPANAAIGVLGPGSTTLRVVSLAADDDELRKHNPAAFARRLGERGFYESTRAGIACQSCHSHADSDGASYNLGDHRVIPTLSVRGLIGTAPYLRDGSYPTIADLDSLAQKLYRGYLRRQPGRASLLEAFVESLPRAQPTAGARDIATERRGYAVFVKAQCGRCHALPAFTNLGLVPMQALFPKRAAALPAGEMLDVPSLLSVGMSAPYLNDGRATTLPAVLRDENPGNLHGTTRQLSTTELRDLIAFLVAL